MMWNVAAAGGSIRRQNVNDARHRSAMTECAHAHAQTHGRGRATIDVYPHHLLSHRYRSISVIRHPDFRWRHTIVIAARCVEVPGTVWCSEDEAGRRSSKCKRAGRWRRRRLEIWRSSMSWLQRVARVEEKEKERETSELHELNGRSSDQRKARHESGFEGRCVLLMSACRERTTVYRSRLDSSLAVKLILESWTG